MTKQWNNNIKRRGKKGEIKKNSLLEFHELIPTPAPPPHLLLIDELLWLEDQAGFLSQRF